LKAQPFQICTAFSLLPPFAMGTVSRTCYGCLVSCSLIFVLSAASGNPFEGLSSSDFYINPINSKQYDNSISTATGTAKDNLKLMQKTPSAYWIDNKGKITKEGNDNPEGSLEGILEAAAAQSKPPLCVFIWYGLPNRDCKAWASNGEICCHRRADGTCNYSDKGECTEGLRMYREEYVDPFIKVLQKYQDKVPTVVVVEPDSLPNLATNLAIPWCGSNSTHAAITKGVKYALHQLDTQASKVTVYLDAAHGGWLGWENSMEAFMKVLKEIEMPTTIRGFATNVANYQPLGVKCPWCPNDGYRNDFCLNGKHASHPCCEDPCGLLTQWNNGNNELNYAQFLVAAADEMLGMKAHVIIDTGRNGVVDNRQDCANWCNPRGSGAGLKSTSHTADPSYVDAYFWLKTPGESDGCSKDLPNGGGRCPRYDKNCKSVDSLSSKASEPRSPEAGQWFDFQVKEIARLANFTAPVKDANAQTGCHEADIPHEVWPHPDDQNLPQDVPVGEKDNQAVAANNGKCAGPFKQCGGQIGGHDWTGPSCCESGCKCDGEGAWYKQCEPPAGEHMCSGGTSRLFEKGTVASSFAPSDRQSAVKMTLMASAALAFALGTCLVVIRSSRNLGSQSQVEELNLLEGHE